MDDWKSLLKTVAPILGAALGGPLGGAAASFIAAQLGLDNKTVASVTALLSTGQLTPEQIGQLRLAEMDMKKFMADHDIKLEQLAADDRNSARKMASETRAITPAILTWVIVVSFIAIEGAMLFGVKTMASDLVVGRILGTLDTSLGLVLAFWFGSNSGSARTKELLAQATLK